MYIKRLCEIRSYIRRIAKNVVTLLQQVKISL